MTAQSTLLASPDHRAPYRRRLWAEPWIVGMICFASASLPLVAQSGVELRILSDVSTQLGDNARFRHLEVEVEGRTVIARGTVAVLEDRREALKRIRQAKHVATVLSHIKVETAPAEDSFLLARLAQDLTENGNGHIALTSKRGFVTVRGVVRDDAHREQVLSSVASTPGVVGLRDFLRIQIK